MKPESVTYEEAVRRLDELAQAASRVASAAWPDMKDKDALKAAYIKALQGMRIEYEKEAK